MIIGDFPTLFGTPQGQQLREWCIQRNWVLIWALAASGQSVMAEWFGQPPIHALFNQRTLDPQVRPSVHAAKTQQESKCQPIE